MNNFFYWFCFLGDTWLDMFRLWWKSVGEMSLCWLWSVELRLGQTRSGSLEKDIKA